MFRIKTLADRHRCAARAGAIAAARRRVGEIGGNAIYATCSLEPEECEQQVESLLGERRDWSAGLAVVELCGDRPGLISEAGDLRTLPVHGIDGFLAARLQKIG